MQKIKIILASLVLTMAVTGVVIAKENKSKRTTYSTVYFISSTGSAVSVSAVSASPFSDVSVSTQAAIKDDNGNLQLLYADQAATVPVKLVP